MWFRSSLAVFIICSLALIALIAAQEVAWMQTNEALIVAQRTKSSVYNVFYQYGDAPLVQLVRRSDDIFMYRQMALYLTLSLGVLTAATGLGELVAKLWRRMRKRPTLTTE